MIELTIPRLPLSPNKTRYKHWRVAHSDKKDWQAQIWVARVNAGRVLAAPAKERMFVEVRLFYARQPLDPDNLHGSIKPVLDALTANGLIYDDSEEWLSYTVTQHKVAKIKEQRTEISISATGIPFLAQEVDR